MEDLTTGLQVTLVINIVHLKHIIITIELYMHVG